MREVWQKGWIPRPNNHTSFKENLTTYIHLQMIWTTIKHEILHTSGYNFRVGFYLAKFTAFDWLNVIGFSQKEPQRSQSISLFLLLHSSPRKNSEGRLYDHTVRHMNKIHNYAHLLKLIRPIIGVLIIIMLSTLDLKKP